MSMQYLCPECSTAVAVPDSLIEKQVRCGACKTVFVVPRAIEEDVEGAGITESPGTVRARSDRLGPVGRSETGARPPQAGQYERGQRSERGRREAAAAGGGNVGLLVGALVGGGALVIVIIVGAAWWLLSSRPDAANNVALQPLPPMPPGPMNPGPMKGIEPAPPLMQAPGPRVDKMKPGPFPPGGPNLGQPNLGQPNVGQPNAPNNGLPPQFPQIPAAPPPPPPPVRLALPPAPPRLPITPAKLAQDKVVRNLPDAIAQVVVGGGGRFLIAHLPKTRQLAVFDANEARFVKYLPLTSDDVAFAAGMTKLLVAYGDAKTIQRWDLVTFARETEAPLPVQYKLCGIGMGYGSDGPLAVQSARESPHLEEHFYFDIAALKRVETPPNHVVPSGPGVRINGSYDGRILSARLPRHDTSSGAIIHLHPTDTKIFRIEGHGGLLPGPDGKHIFDAGVFTSEGRKLGGGIERFDRSAGHIFVPAYQGQYYLRVPVGRYHPQIAGDKRFAPVTVHILGDERPLVTVPDVNGVFRDTFSSNPDPLPLEQRYFLLPDARLLVTIPTEADRFIVHRFDLDQVLDKAGLDYLFVESAPRRSPSAARSTRIRFE